MVRTVQAGNEWWHQRVRSFVTRKYNESNALQATNVWAWNLVDWSMVGASLIGKGLWVVAASFVVIMFPLRRAIEIEQAHVEQRGYALDTDALDSA
jgi:hypothetical protein